MPRPCILAAALVLACRIAGADVPVVPPVVFEGLGLGEMSAAASVARALGTAVRESPPAASVPLDLVVRGPGGEVVGPAPLAAEVRSRVEGFDVAAGVQGDARAFAERAPLWTGRVGVGTADATGLERLELRTRLESRHGANRLGLEIGPRLERSLRKGARVFVDGAATAEAVQAAEAGAWALPGTTAAEGAAVGVSARTGIIR